MKRINNKGFTLIEILAVIVIIAIIGIIAIPNIISTINTGKQASYDIIVEDITIAGKQLYEEIEFTDNELFRYNSQGKTADIIKIEDNTITVNLQTLISNGLLTGSNNPNKSPDGNNNDKIITNPKNDQDISNCEIIIIKEIDTSTLNTNYIIENKSSSSNCPTTEEYKK